MPTGADQPDELGALPVSGSNDSDASGTGERGSATGREGPDNADISPDRVEGNASGDEALRDAEGLDDDVQGLASGDEDGDPQDDLFEERPPRRERRTS
jgi:hypothetical protein